MRTSSMNSRIAAVATLVITLILAVPSVNAKPAHPQQDKGRSVFATVTQMIQRYFGIKANGGYPGDPIPEAAFRVVEDPTTPKNTTFR